jgi:hypothetical protein
MVYRRPDGTTFRELVTLDALRSMGSGLPRGPVTLGHPPDFVTPENAQRYAVGDVDGELVIEEDGEQGAYAKVRIAVRQRPALDAIRAGRHQLSPGYDAEIDPTPGVHPIFGAFDSKQVGRTVNHLAIVDTARGGPTVALRTDSADAEQVSSLPGVTMDPAALDELVKQLVAALKPEVAAAVVEAMKPLLKIETAEGEGAASDPAAMKAELDACKADLAAANGKLAAAEEKKVDGLAARHGVKFDATDKLHQKRVKLAAKIVPSITDAADSRIDGAIAALEVFRADARDSRYDGQPADPNRTDGAGKPIAPINLHEAREKLRAGAAK